MELKMVYSVLILAVFIPVLLGQNIEQPFVAVWNSPTKWCQTKYEIEIPVADYGIIENTGGVWKGDKMVIFYEGELGLYPHLTLDEVPINGGIPQSADFEGHFLKAEDDIIRIIPDKEYSGYAVIDWESWRPMFDRNWTQLRRYQRWSRDLVRQEHPTWSDEEVNVQAKKDFEESARYLMEETLKLGQKLRPYGKWGFYGFPRCYNWDGENTNCTKSNIDLNDKLYWLWEASSAMYPSAYLGSNETEIENARNFVFSENAEALRVRERFASPKTPVYVYTRYTMGDDFYYTKDHLDASLQMAADQGLNGAIIWGSSASSNTKEKCQSLQDYIHDLFGPYVESLIAETESCSLQNCHGNGRCFKKDPLFNHELMPQSIKKGEISSRTGRIISTVLASVGKRSMAYKGLSEQKVNQANIKFMRLSRNIANRKSGYICSCFSGWTGQDCSQIEIESESISLYFA